MEKYINTIKSAYSGYANYFWHELTNFHIGNYFYWLIVLSLIVYVLEIVFPWRKTQAPIRKDFWLDTFYMFFNFFFFNLLIFIALSTTTAELFGDGMAALSLPRYFVFDLAVWPQWMQFLVFFLLADFIQWSVHNVLHRVEWMWSFHKVHHSVTEMGFAAHLRYHFMENVFYKTALYVFLSWLLHFNLQNAFVMHLFTLLIGHLNHANINLNYGFLKYIFNNPRMHIWHHAKELPEQHRHGANFGISLSLWDYLFGTAYMPYDGRDIVLGFDDVESYPDGFIGQTIAPFLPKK